MAEKKEHTLYVRGVPKTIFHSLKRLAKKETGSSTLNGFMLKRLEAMTADEIADFSRNKISSKIKSTTQ